MMKTKEVETALARLQNKLANKIYPYEAVRFNRGKLHELNLADLKVQHFWKGKSFKQTNLMELLRIVLNKVKQAKPTVFKVVLQDRKSFSCRKTRYKRLSSRLPKKRGN
jgi:hypothetical protein